MSTRNGRIGTTRSKLGAVALAALAALAAGSGRPAAAGSLTPPGPPAPTMLSLDTAEPRTPISAVPFTINAGGSYFLTKSLALTIAGGAIVINTQAPVTIDLNGFTLSGGDLSGTVGIVYSSIIATKVTIKNGTLRDFEGGIALQISFSNTRLEDLTVESNFSYGAFLWDAVVTRCQFIQNGQWGLLANNTGIVTNSRASGNAQWGIYAVSRSIVTDCIVDGNGPGTADGGGIGLGSYGIARNNNVVGNHGNGIAIYDHVLVVGNHIAQSDINGIMTLGGGGSRIEGNSCDSNGSTGIASTSGGNVIIRNTLLGNLGGPMALGGTGNVAPLEGSAANNPNSNIWF